MALTARLQFGDNDAKVYPEQYLVEDCHCHFTRQYNHFHPETDPRCERVELTVVAPGRENLSLYEWYISGEPRYSTSRQLPTATSCRRKNCSSKRPTAIPSARYTTSMVPVAAMSAWLLRQRPSPSTGRRSTTFSVTVNPHTSRLWQQYTQMPSRPPSFWGIWRMAN